MKVMPKKRNTAKSNIVQSMVNGDHGQTTPNAVPLVEKELTTDTESVKERNTAAKIVKEATNIMQIATLVNIVQ